MLDLVNLVSTIWTVCSFCGWSPKPLDLPAHSCHVMSTWLWGLSVAVCLLPVRIQRLRVVAVWWWPWHSTGFHWGDPELRSLAIAFWSDKSEDVLFVALRCVLHYMSVSRDFPLPAGFKWFQCNMPHRSSQQKSAGKVPLAAENVRRISITSLGPWWVSSSWL